MEIRGGPVTAKRLENSWYGSFDLADGETGYWRIGPLALWITRAAREWQIIHETSDDPLDSSFHMELGSRSPEPDEEAEHERYGFRRTHGPLVLTPQPADRSLVISAEKPFFIPPGETLILYISTPLWVRIDVGDPIVRLCDLPIYRPADTWFGPSTLEGELCYAARTQARLHLDNLPIRPHRATSAVHIHNLAATVLPLEKLALPMRNLSLFASEDGRLWTEEITLERDADNETAKLKLSKTPPASVSTPRQIAGPRDAPERAGILHVFSGIFK